MKILAWIMIPIVMLLSINFLVIVSDIFSNGIIVLRCHHLIIMRSIIRIRIKECLISNWLYIFRT